MPPKLTYSRNFEFEKADACEEFVKKLQKLLELGSKSLKVLDCELITVPTKLKLVTEKLPKLKVFRLFYDKEEEVEYWVSKLCPETPLDKFILRRYWNWNKSECDSLSFDHLNVDSIINANFLEMTSSTVILRGQFLSLKATQRRIRTDTIKFEVLNEYIRVSGREVQNFEQLVF